MLSTTGLSDLSLRLNWGELPLLHLGTWYGEMAVLLSSEAPETTETLYCTSASQSTCFLGVHSKDDGVGWVWSNYPSQYVRNYFSV